MPTHTLPFYKLFPGGNPTILVMDGALLSASVSPETRASIARALMAPENLGAEQVGFLDTAATPPRMEMMGGEFCVNATRCAAVVFALLGLLPGSPAETAAYEGTMATSGAAGPVRVRVAPARNHEPSAGTTAFDAAVAVPLPRDFLRDSACIRECGPGEVLVRLPGITHLLLDAGRHPLPDSPLEAAARKRAERGLETEEATGVVWYFPSPDAPGTTAIVPVVHVAATGSSVVETACGSGSLALALLRARTGGLGHAIRQPSGDSITVAFEPADAPDGHPLAWISGTVRLTAQGTAHIVL